MVSGEKKRWRGASVVNTCMASSAELKQKSSTQSRAVVLTPLVNQRTSALFIKGFSNFVRLHFGKVKICETRHKKNVHFARIDEQIRGKTCAF